MVIGAFTEPNTVSQLTPLEEHRRVLRLPARRDRARDESRQPRQRAPVGSRQAGDGGHQLLLNGARRTSQRALPHGGDGEPRTPAVVLCRHLDDKSGIHEPLDDDRHRALVRERPCRDLVDRRIRMVGDLLKREEARADGRAPATRAATQRLNDVTERVEDRSSAPARRHDRPG